MRWYSPFKIAVQLMDYDRFGALRMASYTIALLCSFVLACVLLLAGDRGPAFFWLLVSMVFCMLTIVGWFLLGAQCLLRYDRMRDDGKEGE